MRVNVQHWSRLWGFFSLCFSDYLTWQLSSRNIGDETRCCDTWTLRDESAGPFAIGSEIQDAYLETHTGRRAAGLPLMDLNLYGYARDPTNRGLLVEYSNIQASRPP